MSISLLADLLEARALPVAPIGQWPTAVQPLPRLGEQLGVELWVKRDDLSAARYGGNKVRKLELLLGAARAGGHRSVVTVGGIGSNHIVATAIHAGALGLQTHAVVFPQPVTAATRHTAALLAGMGVDLFPCDSRLGVPLAWRRARRRARLPYAIGPGGSSPLGTLGYVAAALELRAQIDAGELPEPDEIYVALGSGGTFAGLRLGSALAGLRSRVVGVRVVERALVNATLVRLLEQRTLRLLRRLAGDAVATAGRPRIDRPTIDHRHSGGRYGRPTPEAEAAVARARSEGLTLDTTYTGKALAALIDRCHRDGARGKRVLFWNTYNSRVIAAPAGRARPLPAAIAQWLT